jgi:cytochrome c553
MLRRKVRAILFLSMALLSLSACSEPGLVADVEEGKRKAAICGQCHGQNGIAIIPIYPNLAGQKQAYMELQLKAFRAGQRINAAMTPHAKRLTDQDIVDLSAFYASLDGNGKGPER